MNRFWLRRLCEAALFISASVLVLYAWARFIPSRVDMSAGFAISDLTAIVAAITCITSVGLYFWLPKERTVAVSLVMYGLVVLTIASLILTSGGVGSPFISLWLLVAVFAGFFGAITTGAMAVIALAQILVSMLERPIAIPTLIIYLIFAIAPLILSFILWHRQPRKKADNSLRELANKLSSVEGKSDIVINSIEDGVVAIDRNGIIDLINPSAQTLVGWNKGDALGLDWRSVLKIVNTEGREVTEMENPIAESLHTNQPVHNDDLSILTNSGKKRMVSIASSPISQTNDGIIVIFRDITKAKAEEREQAEFISTASHEMRTPVASIEGYLGLALNPATATIDEKAREYITKAHESARHLGQLFQNLLDISSSEDGRLKNEPKILDVSASTSDVFESLTPVAEKKGLRYLFKPNPTLESDSAERRLQPVFYADVDPNHFREVVSNLIENAIKYTPQGDVTVDVTGDETMVTISVQDTGIGIPAEDIPHLFQKFYRVDNTDTREIGGTGLGLYLCRRLAETMEGSLRVESEYKKGSTFFLDIPRISHEDAMQRLSEMSEEPAQIISETRPVIDQNPQANYSEVSSLMDYQPPAAVDPQGPVPHVHTIPVEIIETPPPAPVEPPTYVDQPVAAPTPAEQPLAPQQAPIASPTMSLADIEATVAQRQAAYPTSPAQPAPQQPEQAPLTHPTAPTAYAPVDTQPGPQFAPRPAPATYAQRPQSVDVPPRANY